MHKDTVEWIWTAMKNSCEFVFETCEMCMCVLTEQQVWNKRKMGDLYPVIEGPVKFRDGKKVRT